MSAKSTEYVMSPPASTFSRKTLIVGSRAWTASSAMSCPCKIFSDWGQIATASARSRTKVAKARR